MTNPDPNAANASGDPSGTEPPAPLPQTQPQPTRSENELDLSEEEAQALGLGQPEGPRVQQKPKLRLQGEAAGDNPRLSDLMRPEEESLQTIDSAPRKSGTIPLLENRAPRAVLGDAAALFAATRQGRAAEVRHILENGADPMLSDDPANEHAEAIRFLSQNEDVALHHVDGMKLGRTTCHIAAARGHTDVLAVLLEYSVDVNAIDHAGKTPLMLAAFAGHRAIGRMLIEAGARVDLPDIRGGTALLGAARGGHEELVQDLLQGRAPVDAADITGLTPLLAASAGVHGKVVLALLVAGPNVNHFDATGLNALGTVVNAVEPQPPGSPSAFVARPEEQLLPLVKLLLRAGAKNVPDGLGVLPSHHAHNRGYVTLARLLEQHG